MALAEVFMVALMRMVAAVLREAMAGFLLIVLVQAAFHSIRVAGTAEHMAVVAAAALAAGVAVAIHIKGQVVVAQAVLCALFGRVILAHSHQLLQEPHNAFGTLH